MGGGTEAFPDLGRHCQHPECHQLDFLPFICDGCSQVFCLEHRSHKTHECQKSDVQSRKVVVCQTCSTSIETTGLDAVDEKLVLEKHEKSRECDPRKKKKPTCPVKRCRQILTFTNTSTCKTCQLKVCLNHRFPADHACMKGGSLKGAAVTGSANGRFNDKFLAALAARSAKDCGTGTRENGPSSASPASSPALRVH